MANFQTSPSLFIRYWTIFGKFVDTSQGCFAVKLGENLLTGNRDIWRQTFNVKLVLTQSELSLLHTLRVQRPKNGLGVKLDRHVQCIYDYIKSLFGPGVRDVTWRKSQGHSRLNIRKRRESSREPPRRPKNGYLSNLAIHPLLNRFEPYLAKM